MSALGVLLTVFVAITLVVSTDVVRRMDFEHTGRRWYDVVRSRLVMGVPWGTLVVIAFILSIYLFVQDGLSDWNQPVVIPYRAWSYFYPLGMLTAAFSHASEGHLIGNLVGTAVAAPIAEYAWGHYPDSDERGPRSDASWRYNPWVRAIVVFPAAVIAIGLTTSLLALGPVIGFSGVVYAFAGFAIVRYPITTLVALTSAQSALTTIYRAIDRPIFATTAQPSPPSAPSWATVAIQGHALGFFLGLCLAIVLFRRRETLPNPARLWTAVLLFGFAKSLWAIYWFRGSDTYVLYRGPGVIVVAVLALVITVAAVGSNRPLFPAAVRRRVTPDDADTSMRRILELGLPTEDRTEDESALPARTRTHVRDITVGIESDASTRANGGSRQSDTLKSSVTMATRRGTAVLLVVVVLAFIIGPSIPFNAFVLDSSAANPGDESITVEDYTITYAENVENELISVIEVEAFGEDTTVPTSGVIVSSADRNIWTDAVSARELEFSGESTIYVGGPGWRESVTATRQGWTATGGDTAYQIWLQEGSEEPRHVFTSDPARADLTLAGKNVTIVPNRGAFYIVVDSFDDEPSAALIPEEDGRFYVNGITFERDGRAIYAEIDDTRVQIASEERYE